MKPNTQKSHENSVDAARSGADITDLGAEETTAIVGGVGDSGSSPQRVHTPDDLQDGSVDWGNLPNTDTG